MVRKTIGIIGFGMVGRAVQHGFAQITDFRIYDIDKRISENTLEEVYKESDYIFICVPTPMKRGTGEADISIVEYYVYKGLQLIDYPNTILIMKSTVPPGTTRMLQEKYKGVRLIFNPEFLTARTSRLDFINTSRIILGGSYEDTESVEELYRMRFPHTPIYKTDSTTAEMVKYAANCFFAVKVSLMNEYYQICEKLGVDYKEMKEMMMADGRIGNSHLDVPGHDGDFGFGNLCFPKDINALIFKAKEMGVDPKILEAAWKKNLEVRKNRDWEKIKGAVSD